jgi:hypothetical protein
MNRVIQSGGRVIRTPEDQGFVMLICRRFTSRMYANRFPAYWSGEMQIAEDPVPAVRAFWKRVGDVSREEPARELEQNSAPSPAPGGKLPAAAKPQRRKPQKKTARPT